MKTGSKPTIAILASGRGSNFRAIATAMKSEELKVNIALLIVDNRDAKAVEIAKEFNIKSFIVERGNYKEKSLFELALVEILNKASVDIVCLAGFMRILSPLFLAKLDAEAIINIHPSLLPKYRGFNPQQQALDANETKSGCTVHFVDGGVDTGRIITQEEVAIEEGETLESLTAKILAKEHQVYPRAINILIQDKNYEN